jgi:hypothetical protein
VQLMDMFSPLLTERTVSLGPYGSAQPGHHTSLPYRSDAQPYPLVYRAFGRLRPRLGRAAPAGAKPSFVPAGPCPKPPAAFVRTSPASADSTFRPRTTHSRPRARRPPDCATARSSNKAVAYDLLFKAGPILVAGWPNYHTNVHCRVTQRGRHVIHRRKLLRLTGATAAVTVWPQAAWAETYPSRPVRILVGYAAGGGVDIAARLIGPD